jgi:hypothetical protein
MVKQINIFLDDEEHERILKVKGDMTWKDFLIILSEIALDEKLVEKKKNEKLKRGK